MNLSLGVCDEAVGGRSSEFVTGVVEKGRMTTNRMVCLLGGVRIELLLCESGCRIPLLVSGDVFLLYEE